MYFVFCRLYPSSPSHHGIVWLLPVISLHLKVHKHESFFYFFCRNRNHMVPRACNTRFLKIVFDSAEIFDFKTFPRMLSLWWHRFRVCSACDEIRSTYAQCAIKFVPRMLSMDFICKNCSHFTAGWACAEIRSSYAQYAMKSVPCMFSMR
jgi:hypothetical protein